MDLKWKLRCSLALMAQPWSAHCILMVVFSVKLLPVTFSRANTLQHGRCFMAGLPAGPGYFQSWVQPLSLLELECYSFCLSRAVNDVAQGRHSGRRSELHWVIQVQEAAASNWDSQFSLTIPSSRWVFQSASFWLFWAGLLFYRGIANFFKLSLFISTAVKMF